MPQLFANNSWSFLNGGINTVTTSIALSTGQGSRFPSPTGGDYFLLTLIGLTDGAETSWEIVKVTARTGDVLTVVRAQEGSTAVSWLSGARVELRMTAGQAALFDDKYSKAETDQKVADLVAAAPGTLDTLNELAAALGDDENFAATMATDLAGKVDDSQVLTDVPAGAVFTDTQLSDGQVETAYNTQVAVVSQADAEAGVSTANKRWTPERVSQAITALSTGGGGGGISDTYTADVVIAAGDPVWLKDDGKLTRPYWATSVVTAAASSASVLEMVSCYEAFSGHMVVFYADSGNSNYGYVVAGELQPDGTFTWGTAVSLGYPEAVNQLAISPLPGTNKVIISYSNNPGGYDAQSHVVSFTGGASTVGLRYEYNSAGSNAPRALYGVSDVLVLCLGQESGDGRLEALWLDIADTIISESVNADVLADNIAISYPAAQYDSVNDRGIAIWLEGGVITARTYGLTGVLGTESTFSSTTADEFHTLSMGDNSVLIVFFDVTNNDLRALVLSVDAGGTTISFGTAVQIDAGGVPENIKLAYDVEKAEFVVSFNGGYATAQKTVTCTVSGTVVTATTGSTNIQTLFVTDLYSGNLAYVSDKIVSVGYDALTTTTDTRAIETIYYSSGRLLGLAAESIAEAASGVVDSLGTTNDQQTGLTAGELYYVDAEGALGTRGNRLAGYALSATEILVLTVVDSDIQHNSTYGLHAHGTLTSDKEISLYDGAIQSLTVGAPLSLDFSGWLEAGNYSEIKLELTNGGAYAITWPNNILWSSGGTFVSGFSGSLAASGYNTVVLWSTSGGVTIYGAVL